MKFSSLRGSVMSLAGLYTASLVISCGLLGGNPSSSAPRRPEPLRQAQSQPGRSTPGARRGATGTPAEKSSPQPTKASSPQAGIKGGDGAVANAKPTAAESDRASGTPPRGAVSFADRKKPLDPVATNGAFFEGWTKPAAVLVLTGRLEGFLEPCGCAGIENQKGGLARRFTMMDEMRKKGWPVAGIDLGGLVRRFGKQAEIQLEVTADALKQMGYFAVGFGAEDLRLPATDLLNVTSMDDRQIFVAGNYTILDRDLSPPAYRIQQVGALNVGVTTIFSKEYQRRAQTSEIEFTDPETAIRSVLPQLESCDVRLLMAYATTEEAQELAQKFPEFEYVVSAGGGDEPPPKWSRIPGSKSQTRLIEVGHKGMFAVVLGFFNDAPVRYQRVAIDSRYADAPQMIELKTNYQQHLQFLGWDRLEINRRSPVPRANASIPDSAKFVGSKACADCHQSEYDVWAASKHAHATDTLMELKPARQFDPECINCHSTGWDPQQFVPYAFGFDSVEKTPHLIGNGCENCHGPGGAHVAAENGDDAKLQARVRKMMAAEKSELSCTICHDGDNSPQFTEIGFERYWAEIAHGKHSGGK